MNDKRLTLEIRASRRKILENRAAGARSRAIVAAEIVKLKALNEQRARNLEAERKKADQDKTEYVDQLTVCQTQLRKIAATILNHFPGELMPSGRSIADAACDIIRRTAENDAKEKTKTEPARP